ncbi:MAG: hypothetical protein HQ592_00335, partial [Planctomycetes bacterium]|nr:hypothetical protein [Planctomycetota bacterium]
MNTLIKRIRIIVCSVLLLAAASASYAKPYIALSLKQAEAGLRAGGGEAAMINRLGGITLIAGLVYDKESGDPIIVGEINTSDPAPLLDDVVVGLRARILHDEWPVVSIEPAKKTPETGKFKVRFEGNVAGTHYGRRLFEADVMLKKIGLGLIPSGIPGFASYYDLCTAGASKNPNGVVD